MASSHALVTRARLATSGVIALVAVAAVVAVGWSSRHPDSWRGGVGGTPRGAIPGEPSPDPVSGLPPVPGGAAMTVTGDGAVDATYETCALALGFDPGGVQVLVGASGAPVWVKTGRDVPAAVHRPCFRLVGGTDPLRSSHGRWFRR